MKKATHYGECQLCARQQKLPGSVLSQHGYTKRWHVFEGVCSGAGYPPFEISMDRIPPAIEGVLLNIARLETSITELHAQPITDEAPYLNYGSFGPVEVNVKVVAANPEQPTWITLVLPKVGDKPGRSIPSLQCGCRGTVAEVIQQLRVKRAARIQGRINELNEYVKWQQGRIANWRPQELKPVEV